MLESAIGQSPNWLDEWLDQDSRWRGTIRKFKIVASSNSIMPVCTEFMEHAKDEYTLDAP